MSVIKHNIKPDSFIYIDSDRSYNILNTSEFKYFKVSHSKEFTCGQNHINDIEGFWNYSKRFRVSHSKEFTCGKNNHINGIENF